MGCHKVSSFSLSRITWAFLKLLADNVLDVVARKIKHKTFFTYSLCFTCNHGVRVSRLATWYQFFFVNEKTKTFLWSICLTFHHEFKHMTSVSNAKMQWTDRSTFVHARIPLSYLKLKLQPRGESGLGIRGPNHLKSPFCAAIPRRLRPYGERWWLMRQSSRCFSDDAANSRIMSKQSSPCRNNKIAMSVRASNDRPSIRHGALRLTFARRHHHRRRACLRTLSSHDQSKYVRPNRTQKSAQTAATSGVLLIERSSLHATEC